MVVYSLIVTITVIHVTCHCEYWSLESGQHYPLHAAEAHVVALAPAQPRHHHAVPVLVTSHSSIVITDHTA